jgi:hypothetical protein
VDYESINFEPLKEKSKHPVLESVFILTALAFLIAFLVFAIRAKIYWSAKDALLGFPCMGLALLFLYLTDKVATKSVVMPLFIAANGFGQGDYAADWQQIDDEGVALTGRLKNKKLGTTGFRLTNSFNGSLGTRSFTAFELMRSGEDVISSKKVIDLRPYMLVVTFNVNRDLPHVYIADHKTGKGAKSAVGVYEESWLYEQPGNFKAINKDPKKYAIYAPDKLEPEALTLLSPPVLEAIANAGAGCDIEFLHGRIIFYQYVGWIEERYRAYKNAFSLASNLLPAMERTLQTMRFDAASDLNQNAKDIFYENK